MPQIYIRLFSPPSKHTSRIIRSLTPGSTNARVPLFRSVPLFKFRWLRNFNRMCIGYAFRPRLSSRLTRSGRTFLLKPEAFGHYDSHIILATHSGILTSLKSTCASAHASPRRERSPTIYIIKTYIPSFGTLFSPVEFSAQGHSTSELLRTLLMSGCF